MKSAGLRSGDRAIYFGIGQLRGRHCDILSARSQFAGVAIDDGPRVLALTRDLHPIPRRPKPDF